MSRQLRIEFEGAFYHIIARGNERRNIFVDDGDNIRFLRVLGEAARSQGFRYHAYALMPNHYHLLVETPRGELAKGMQHINQIYAQYFNARHDRVGHLFQGRYKALLIERDRYFLALSRYIHQNPVRAELATRAWEYRWSGCGAMVGLQRSPWWLDTRATLEHFQGDLRGMQENYRSFVSCIGEEDPFERAVGQTVLGSPSFVEKWTSVVGHRAAEDADVAMALRRPASVPADQVRQAVRRLRGLDEVESRRWMPGRWGLAEAYLLRERSRLSFREIGSLMGLGISGVRKRIIQAGMLMRSEPGWRVLLTQLEDSVAGKVMGGSEKCKVQV